MSMVGCDWVRDDCFWVVCVVWRDVFWECGFCGVGCVVVCGVVLGCVWFVVWGWCGFFVVGVYGEGCVLRLNVF